MIKFNKSSFTDRPEVVAHWSSGLVRLWWVPVQAVEVVLWFTVFYIQVQVTSPINHDANGPSLSGHKQTHNVYLRWVSPASQHWGQIRTYLPHGLLFQNWSQTFWQCLQVWIWDRVETSLDRKGICWYRQNQSPPPDYSWKHDWFLKRARLQSSSISLLYLQTDRLWVYLNCDGRFISYLVTLNKGKVTEFLMNSV